MHCGQMLVAIAEMILAELTGRITEMLHELADRWILEVQA